jgi:hypothetical protein
MNCFLIKELKEASQHNYNIMLSDFNQERTIQTMYKHEINCFMEKVGYSILYTGFPIIYNNYNNTIKIISYNAN